MKKKWKKVQAFVPIASELHFVEKEEKKANPKRWSMATPNVTCLEIWKTCGKMKHDEHIVAVAYEWRVVSKKEESVTSLQWMEETPRLLDLLSDSESTKKQMTDLNQSTSPKSTDGHSPQTLQAFSESFTFESKSDRDLSNSVFETISEDKSLKVQEKDLSEGLEYSPTTHRLRRRITPILVETKECQL